MTVMTAEEREREIYRATMRARREIIHALRQLEECTGRRVTGVDITEDDVTELGCPYKETIRGVRIDLDRPIAHRRWVNLGPLTIQEPPR